MKIVFECDAANYERALLSLVQSANASGKVADSLVGLFGSPLQTFSLQCDGFAAAGAGYLRVRVEPSDGLLDLLAAAGTTEVNAGVV
jgi:hypothetical protein